MKTEAYEKLVNFVESQKDKGRVFVMGSIDHDGKCEFHFNASLPEVIFIQKMMDQIIDKMAYGQIPRPSDQ